MQIRGVITIPYAACCAAASTTRVPSCTYATECLNKTFSDKKLIQPKQTFYSIDNLPSQAGYIFVRSEKSCNCDRWMSWWILTFVSPAEQDPSSRTSPIFLHFVWKQRWPWLTKHSIVIGKRWFIAEQCLDKRQEIWIQQQNIVTNGFLYTSPVKLRWNQV